LQHNFRIQLVAAIATVGRLLWRVSADDWRWLVLAIAIVLAAELVNTAFEHLCDVVQPELHASVKAAKDVARAQFWLRLSEQR
jgi:diacylglycerol kinase (ATP)